MAARNPRISVVVTPSLRAVLAELAGETGQSMSSLVGELLGASERPLQRTVALVRAARHARGELASGLGDSLVSGVARINDTLDLEMGRMDRVISDLASDGERIGRRRRVAAAVTPLPLTGGSSRAGRPPGKVKKPRGKPGR